MLLAALIALGSANPGHYRQPRWFDNKIAGYMFDEQHDEALFRDPKNGFFIFRDNDCDGADLTLLLTRDRKKLAEPTGYKQATFRNLKTGKGVSIGDSPSQVIALLGKPTSRDLTGSRNQFVTLDYSWTDDSKVRQADTAQYHEDYTFKGGKLIEIEFTKSTDGVIDIGS